MPPNAFLSSSDLVPAEQQLEKAFFTLGGQDYRRQGQSAIHRDEGHPSCTDETLYNLSSCLLSSQDYGNTEKPQFQCHP